MTGADYACRLSRLLNADVTDLERFVRGIGRRAIQDLVKRNEYLQRHVFAGFRPNRLPWSLVPTRLARHAAGNSTAVGALLRLWLAEHDELCKRVTECVSPGTAEEDAAWLLATLGEKQRETLFCALFLDVRPELQEILADGLRVALLERTPDFERLVGRSQDEAAKRAEGEGGAAGSCEGPPADETADAFPNELETPATAGVLQGQPAGNHSGQETEVAKMSSPAGEPADASDPAMTAPNGIIRRGEAACPNEIPLVRLDERWAAAVEAIARHLGLPEVRTGASSWPTSSQDRWVDWQTWQEIEAALVSRLLESPGAADGDRRSYLRRAQKLLALRWYLLEALCDAMGGHCSG
jgi:hypothetical protein